jgi:hypothetical protein
MTAVRFQVVLVTGGISKISMAIGAFERGTVRETGGIGQTKRATMRAGGTMVFDVGIAFVTIVTIIFVFSHPGHGKYDIVVLIIVKDIQTGSVSLAFVEGF